MSQIPNTAFVHATPHPRSLLPLLAPKHFDVHYLWLRLELLWRGLLLNRLLLLSLELLLLLLCCLWLSLEPVLGIRDILVRIRIRLLSLVTLRMEKNLFFSHIFFFINYPQSGTLSSVFKAKRGRNGSKKPKTYIINVS
jgi:hypothetical protein